MKRIALARKKIKVGTFIFEIDDSEISYNRQRHLEHLVAGPVAAMKKVALVKLNKLRANTYSKFKINYREKKLKKQMKISQHKMKLR
jgi:hypothetical protein